MFAKLESLERKFLDLGQVLADRISSPWWTFSASTAN